ncbi:FMN-dependent NADH-azoreductase [uncultured archaeon]|nr:FMN-dependent NADH-azoreductase [uncultured archaeon]
MTMQQEQPIKIKVIIGSTRQNRFSEKPAHWIYEEAKKKAGVEIEILDLRDYPMPFFNDPVSPAMSGGKYTDRTVKKWAEKINDGDAFIIVSPEYNHGYSGVLKNALDSIFPEWNRKAVGFVGYGNAGGARSVEQLRQVAIELQMVPIRSAIHIPVDVYMTVMNEKVPVNSELFKPLKMPVDRVEVFLSELISMAKALKVAREQNI